MVQRSKATTGGGIKEVDIEGGKKAKIDDDLDPQAERELIEVLKEIRYLFAWSPTDMIDIDPNFIGHKLKEKENVTRKSRDCIRGNTEIVCSKPHPRNTIP